MSGLNSSISILLIISLLFLPCARAQSDIVMTFYVIDEQKEGIEDVFISIEKENTSTVITGSTDGEGRSDISLPETYGGSPIDIKASKDGYHTKIIEGIQAEDGKSLTIDLEEREVETTTNTTTNTTYLFGLISKQNLTIALVVGGLFIILLIMLAIIELSTDVLRSGGRMGR